MPQRDIGVIHTLCRAELRGAAPAACFEKESFEFSDSLGWNCGCALRHMRKFVSNNSYKMVVSSRASRNARAAETNLDRIPTTHTTTCYGVSSICGAAAIRSSADSDVVQVSALRQGIRVHQKDNCVPQLSFCDEFDVERTSRRVSNSPILRHTPFGLPLDDRSNELFINHGRQRL